MLWVLPTKSLCQIIKEIILSLIKTTILKIQGPGRWFSGLKHMLCMKEPDSLVLQDPLAPSQEQPP